MFLQLGGSIPLPDASTATLRPWGCRVPLRRIPEGSSLEAWRERPFRKRNGGLLGNGVSRDESFVDGLDVIFGAGRVAAHEDGMPSASRAGLSP